MNNQRGQRPFWRYKRSMNRSTWYYFLTMLVVASVMIGSAQAEELSIRALPSTSQQKCDDSRSSVDLIREDSSRSTSKGDRADCSAKLSQPEMTAALEAVLREHPDLIWNALENNPVAFIGLIERAAELRKVKVEEDRLQTELQHPKVPEIDNHRPIRGTRNAPVTIVEYSDFECPFCRVASATLKDLLLDHEGMVRFVYKHTPLEFHPMAEPAARYFEAIALQSEEEAWRFHDRVFERHQDLAKGIDTLKEIVATLAVDRDRLEQDLRGEIVEGRLAADRAESQRFGFNGTPAFVINGLSMVGSQPKQDFERIINMAVSQAGGHTSTLVQ